MFNGTYKEILTKEEILTHLDQNMIFFKYLGIYPDFGKKYRSPFRTDKTPGCSFKEWSGVLYFIENSRFNNRLLWNIFDVVCYTHNCDFKKSLEIITRDFENNFDREHIIKMREQYDLKFQIRVVSKPWKQENFFGVSPDILYKERILLVDDYWTGKSQLYKNNYHNPKTTLTIAYLCKSGNIKLYFPDKQENRFITNCDSFDVYGYEFIDNMDFSKPLCITKSQKDRIAAIYHLGISNCVAVQSEGISIPLEYIENMKSKFPDIYVLYDNDESGIRSSNNLVSKHNFKQIALSSAKDLWELKNLINEQNCKRQDNRQTVYCTDRDYLQEIFASNRF